MAALGGDVRRELPFTFEVWPATVSVAGSTFTTAPADGAALVVNYKTNLLGERDPEQLVEDSYRHQVEIYALAVLRAGHLGRDRLHAFLERPDALVTAVRRGHREMRPVWSCAAR